MTAGKDRQRSISAKDGKFHVLRRGEGRETCLHPQVNKNDKDMGRMNSNYRERVRRAAKVAVELYRKALAEGCTNQEAIDKARFDKRVLVSDPTMRRYIRLMEEEETA